MTPLAADGVGADQQALVRHYATATAGAEDDPEHQVGAPAGPIHGLGQREAVRIVGHPYRLTEGGLEIGLERMAIEEQAVGVLDATVVGTHRPRQANTDAKGGAGLLGKAADKPGHHLDEGGIALLRGCDAAPTQLVAATIEQQPLHLGATDVQSQS
ncbi:hypothetical protein D3C73_907730 [compost metagenome]